MTFAVVDDHGEVIGRDKSLSALQESLKPIARQSIARVSERRKDSLERAGITTWDFDSLERIRDTKHGGHTIRAYPALVDEGSSAAIRLMSTAGDQAAAHPAGIRRLLLNAIPSPTSYVNEHLTTSEKLTLAQSPYRTTAALFDDCIVAVIDSVIDDSQIWTREEFETARDAVSTAMIDSLFETVALVSRVVALTQQVDKTIRAVTAMAFIAPLSDARAQLDALVYPGFVGATGLQQLKRVPVYLDGILHRFSKLSENPGRDRVWMTEIERATARYREAGGDLPCTSENARLERARWMLEEFRLSLFAQHLGTAEPVSLQRISKVLAD
jgi:ATP-dependent helicase HrpA